MTPAKTALHILHRIKQDPRLAYLIGLGSETFELLVRDAALAQDLDIDVARRLHSTGLRFEQWPSNLVIQQRIDAAVSAVQQATQGVPA